MTSERRITKAEILGGRATIRYEWIEALGAEVPLRCLSSRQKAEVEARMTRGLTLDLSDLDPSMDGKEALAAMQQGDKAGGVNVSIDLEAMALAEVEAQVLAVHYGLAFEPPVTLDEVDEIDPLAVEQIAKVVFRMSGVKQEDLKSLAAFRGKR